ncbi:MAG: hypothetical protein QM537_00250 [Candidatus Symbiobacter sp.]|nr:hypothetical protein [Candidatus Symbiobacter sp.]
MISVLPIFVEPICLGPNFHVSSLQAIHSQGADFYLAVLSQAAAAKNIFGIEKHFWD